MPASRCGGQPTRRFALLAAVVLVAGAAIAWTAGAFSSDASAPNCVAIEGLEGCREGWGLDGATAVALSPDGRSVYVAGDTSNTVSIMRRDSVSGKLTQQRGAAGCLSGNRATRLLAGVKTVCKRVAAVRFPLGIAVSPDGRNVYVTGFDSDSLAIFDRDPSTGALTQKAGKAGCLSWDQAPRRECRRARALGAPRGVAVSPDGRSVYVASVSLSAIAVFDRDGSGELTQKAGAVGCVSEGGSGGACRRGRALHAPVALAISPDGKDVYAAAASSNAVAILGRDPATGALTQSRGVAGCIAESGGGDRCGRARALREPVGIAVSPDGKSVYVASSRSEALTVFRRASATGTLTQDPGPSGCVLESGTKGACRRGRGLFDVDAVAVSPDGRSVYTTGQQYVSSALGIFSRDPANGALTQARGPDGCFAESEDSGSCRPSALLPSSSSGVAVSPDGAQVFVIAGIGAVSAFPR
jgi:DNA-binding beta-propeller fold protein YncE